MLFTHSANSRPITTLAPLFFTLTPTAWNVSKFSWFPSLPSWRMRNFLGKHFTFLATTDPLGLLCIACFALLSAPPPPSVLWCWPTTCSLGGRGECGLPTRLKCFAELALRFTVNSECAECSCWIPHKRKKGLFPPAWTSELEKGQICVWVDTRVSASEEIQHPDPTSEARETVLWHWEDPVKIITLGTMSLNSFLSCSCFTYFPPLPFRHFLSCTCQQQHRGHYFRYKTLQGGWMSAHHT